MATHVAVRLYWRDHGWDGTVCRDPEGNVWWERHDHIRDYKDLAEEASEAGMRFVTATAKPPCGASAQALARSANRIVFHPPDWMAGMGVQPVEWDLHSATARWSTRRCAIPRPWLCLREGLGRAADGSLRRLLRAAGRGAAARAREADPARALDATAALAAWLGSRFAPLDELPAARHRVLRTDRGVEEIVLDLTTWVDRQWT